MHGAFPPESGVPGPCRILRLAVLEFTVVSGTMLLPAHSLRLEASFSGPIMRRGHHAVG